MAPKAARSAPFFGPRPWLQFMQGNAKHADWCDESAHTGAGRAHKVARRKDKATLGTGFVYFSNMQSGPWLQNALAKT